MSAYKNNSSPLIGTLPAAVLVTGIYYTITGAWPLLNISSFMMVTGFKYDQWLVKMVALLALSSGLVALYGRRKREFSGVLFLLLTLNGISFAAIDLYYSSIGRISVIYLLDAAPELCIALYFGLHFIKNNTSITPDGTGISA